MFFIWSKSDFGFITALVLTLPVAALLTGAPAWLTTAEAKEQRRYQSMRNAQAQTIADSVCAKTVPNEPSSITDYVPFSLWLRPFRGASDSSTIVRRYAKNRHQTGWEVVVSNIAHPIARALELTAPLITVGGSADTIGAGRVRCEDEKWQQLVLDLMHASRYIFVIPDTTPSLQWEVEEILSRSELLDKCIFVVPQHFSLTVNEKLDNPSYVPVDKARRSVHVRQRAIEALSAWVPADQLRHLDETDQRAGHFLRLTRRNGVLRAAFIPLKGMLTSDGEVGDEQLRKALGQRP
jgi:hypothetical protein